MSAISGFFNPQRNFMEQEEHSLTLLQKMNRTLSHRGPDDDGSFLSSSIGLAYSGLILSKKQAGQQPVYRQRGNFTSALVLDGEIYNRNALVQYLSQNHCFTGSESDADLLLTGLLEYGTDFLQQVNGVFAIAWYQEKEQSLTLIRDRMGVKPLFYTIINDTLVFASELKGLFCFPGIHAQVDKDGLNEIFSVGPAKTPGCGVYKNIHEVLPSHFIIKTKRDLSQISYWTLTSHPHTDSFQQTKDHVLFLLEDAVHNQLQADVPVCSFLSGGIDSSLISSLCSRELKKQNRQLITFSFDFKDNSTNFKANAFQPSLDRPFVDIMVRYLNSDHHFLECDSSSQADGLITSVQAHDLPSMADVDSSLLYFCSQVSPISKAAMTGECADEVFGGYPWFHKKELLHAQTFPWSMSIEARQVLLSESFIKELQMEQYSTKRYNETLSHIPFHPDDTPKQRLLRKISYLNLSWFMQTLLRRMDRTSAHSGMTAHAPFADYRLVQYLWNIPWEMKAHNGIIKGLLRESAQSLLPEEILWRKKSPYPKTYDTCYESLLQERFYDILHTQSSPILPFIDIKKTEQFLSSPSDYGKPWYGQLMAAPQMLAYLIQVNEWMKQYHIELI